MSQVSDYDTEEPDEFDKAVDELLASSDNAPADAAADDQEDPSEARQPVEAQPGSADAEAGKVDQTAGTPPPVQTQSDDIWANAPPEFREAFERERSNWQHRLNSTQGRLSAADRELARLRRESGARPGGSGGQGQPGGNAEASPEDPFQAEELKQLEEEYGEVAGPLLKLTKGLYERLNRLEAPVAEVAQQRETEVRQSQISVFTSAHPDWETYVNDERYPEWLSQQPLAVQEAAARAVNVEDGHEAAWLLSQFKASLGASSARPAPNPAPSNQQSVADLKRSRQLAAGRDAGPSAPPVQSGMPDDFDAAVDAIITSRERRQGRQGQFS